mmetsp:Transcript_4744/g.6162  ORF Transcript_4744/g.6162 Transcript_4744/m.6162 type:complete len:200 (+) Transcript_4744:517-1116(+)
MYLYGNNSRTTKSQRWTSFVSLHASTSDKESKQYNFNCASARCIMNGFLSHVPLPEDHIRIVELIQQFLKAFKVDDARELGCIKRSSTHQCTINIRLCHEFVDGFWRHGSTVQDACSIGSFLVENICQDTAALCMNILGYFRSGNLSGTNSPNWLVGNSHARHVFLRNTSQSLLQLHCTNGTSKILFIFSFRFTNAKHN